MAFKPLATTVAALLLAVGGAGCGSNADMRDDEADSAPPSASSQPASPDGSGMSGADESAEAEDAEPVVITIADFAFTGPDSVAPGATITVVNEDRSSHTITSETDDFEEVVLEGGEDGTFTAPTEPGTYAYVCAFHPEMTGTLVVK